jgi:hypothetical protein
MQLLNSKFSWAPIVIWSIQYQDRISHHFRLFMLGIAMVITFMGMVGLVSLEVALWSLFFGGLSIIGAAWYLIQLRRTWLLHIEDPALKQVVYETMLTYIYLKKSCLRQAKVGKDCGLPSELMRSNNPSSSNRLA